MPPHSKESLFRRPFPNDGIAYHHVGDREPIGTNLPILLKSPLLRILLKLPKGGYQAINPIRYQQATVEENRPAPFQFEVIYSENFSDWVARHSQRYALFHIFLWHTNQRGALEALARFPHPHYILPAGIDITDALEKSGVNRSRIANDELQILQRIEGLMREEGMMPDGDIDNAKDYAQRTFDTFARAYLPEKSLPFGPVWVNRQQINQIFGNFSQRSQENSENVFARRAPELATSFSATEQALRYVTQADAGDAEYIILPPPAILAFPSVHPYRRKTLANTKGLSRAERNIVRDLIAADCAEQDSITYVNQLAMRSDTDQEQIFRAGSGEITAYTHFFDVVGSLHASFGHSPYVRAPLKGKSLAQEHSFFSPKTFRANGNPRSITRRVFAFGELLGAALHPDLQQVIQGYPGGIVAISDLPVEWLSIAGVPLCFSKSICRLPETVVTNLLAQFNFNRMFGFRVTSELPSRTLIVCGANVGDPIFSGFESFQRKSAELGAPWKFAHCLSLDSFFEALDTHKPELLVIDSHGHYVQDERGTEIQLGSEFLTGDILIERRRQVPLVILSACWGSPLYGCSNTIAHAFFQCGSFSVTSALLPVSVTKGGIFYQRILRNLTEACLKPIHDTWSSFIGYTTRTSYLADLHFRVIDQFGPKYFLGSTEFERQQMPWTKKCFYEVDCVEAFKEAHDVVARCFAVEIRPQIKVLLDDRSYLPEFMFYSTMGRADLVTFEAWEVGRVLRKIQSGETVPAT